MDTTPLIQPIYAIPIGFKSRHLERGAIQQVIQYANNWLSDQTGGLRFRVADKVIVIRVPYTRHPNVLTFDRTLGAPSGTINAVFYDAPRAEIVMTATWPPLVPGHTVLLSIIRLPLFTDTWSLVFLHEVFHSIGIVPNTDAHVHDYTCDLMAEDLCLDRSKVVLDWKRDDYWNYMLTKLSPGLLESRCDCTQTRKGLLVGNRKH